VAANLFQDAEEREAATRLWKTPPGLDDTPVFLMLRYENLDPWEVPVIREQKYI
jgi:hypothetical protein